MVFNLKINFKMRKFATLFAMLMLFAGLAFGQTRTITGTVTVWFVSPGGNTTVPLVVT